MRCVQELELSREKEAELAHAEFDWVGMQWPEATEQPKSALPPDGAPDVVLVPQDEHQRLRRMRLGIQCNAPKRGAIRGRRRWG